MNSRWCALVAASLVAFASLVIAWQFLHYDRKLFGSGSYGPLSSVAQSCIRSEQMAKISDIVKRDQIIIRASGLCRYVDLVLPKDARVFMPDMTGPTNYDKIMNYYFVIYYLFPREVGVSVDQPTRITKDGFLGRTAESDQEILTNGYDAIVDFPPH